MITKISSTEVNATLVKAAGILRSQQQEISQLRQEIAVLNRHNHAEKIASQAVERGIMDPIDAREYAQSLADGDKDLSMVEDFVSQTTAGIPLGSGLAKTASEYRGSDNDPLTQFLLSSDI